MPKPQNQRLTKAANHRLLAVQFSLFSLVRRIEPCRMLPSYMTAQVCIAFISSAILYRGTIILLPNISCICVLLWYFWHFSVSSISLRQPHLILYQYDDFDATLDEMEAFPTAETCRFAYSAHWPDVVNSKCKRSIERDKHYPIVSHYNKVKQANLKCNQNA